nr:PLP-dependent aminotransferase family protein [uncultured Faecalimonas sp.]
MNELTISLDPRSDLPLYEQIYQYIKEDIQSGRLACGIRLPSSRSLAGYLEISRSTVELAYEQLLSEGYIETKPRRGVFVAQIDELYQFGRKKQQKEEVHVEQRQVYRYDFSPSGIDLKSFPYAVWRKLSREVLLDDRAETFHLGDSQGEYGLRSAISSYLHQARGVRCRPEQIIVGAGNDYLLMLLINILGRDRKVAFETPTYKQAYRLFAHLAEEVCTVEMDQSGMRADLLEKSGAQIAYVMPSHQFPLGVVMPIGRRMELLKWADRGDRYIIEDDYDSEFRYKGKPIPALQGYDAHDRVVYLGTFSRSIAPALRMSYMVLPERLLAVYQKEYRFLNSTVSKIDQMIVERFLTDGHYERHLNRMRTLYKNRHDTLLSALKPLLKVGSVSGEYAGVHLLFTFHDGRSEQDAVKKAEECGIRIYGLSAFETQKSQKSCTVLLGFANLQEEEIREGAALLTERLLDE